MVGNSTTIQSWPTHAGSDTNLFICIHHNSIKWQLIRTANYCTSTMLISSPEVYNVRIMVELALSFSILLVFWTNRNMALCSTHRIGLSSGWNVILPLILLLQRQLSIGFLTSAIRGINLDVPIVNRLIFKAPCKTVTHWKRLSDPSRMLRHLHPHTKQTLKPALPQ